MTRPCPRQRGAALLIAMIIVTLVATLASAMVWHQQRAVDVETAERARAQAAWLLEGALDWAKVLMRSGADKAFPPSAGWVSKLEESRLSQFLAADRDNSADANLDVFLSGEIGDAQGRYNLRRLVGDDGKVVPAELAGLRRLCEAAGAGAELADGLAAGLADAWYGRSESAALPPVRIEQLAWLGLDAARLAQVAPYVALLPVRTPLNANTAEAPALLAAIDALDLGNAQRLVQSLKRSPAASSDELRAQLPASVTIDDGRVGVRSSYFEVLGRLRYEDRLLQERWLLARSNNGLTLLRRERLSFVGDATR
ncbi:MAG: type II secretion system minor pseudopilin GspK [Proteobacteria bacterium]|nr:type II secretion system minor pseudopilin GspK [Pseudomonadota bacterium]